MPPRVKPPSHACKPPVALGPMQGPEPFDLISMLLGGPTQGPVNNNALAEQQAQITGPLKQQIEGFKDLSKAMRESGLTGSALTEYEKALNEAVKNNIKLTPEFTADLEDLAKRQAEAAQGYESGSFFGGFKAGILEMKKDIKSLGDIGKDAAKTFVDSWVSASDTVIFEGGKIVDMFRTIALDMSKMLFNAAERNLLVGLLGQGFMGGTSGGGMFGGLFGGLLGLGGTQAAVSLGGSTVSNAVTGASMSAALTMSRGGLVYASSGLFRPRGTDTVPAMLTPEEAVLDVRHDAPAAERPVGPRRVARWQRNGLNEPNGAFA